MLKNGKSLGIALSGGGFRAALYHVGVLKQLLEWDLLWELDLISSLSGGSIVGAFIAQHWQDEKALDEIERYLTTKSLTANYYHGIVSPFKTRTQVMAQSLRKDLFGNATLAELSNGPRSYISASNLASGDLFSFIAGGKRDALVGESKLGFQHDNAEDFKLADAVAASCAFAPIFPPYRLNQQVYKSTSNFVTLTDGGLYDNLGIDPLLKKDTPIDYAFVSDGGKPLSMEPQPTESGVVAVWRSIDVLTEKVRVLQLERLNLRFQCQQGPKPICFSIDSSEGSRHAQFCSAVPSELSKLDQNTSRLLQRHAQNLLKHRMTNLAPELLNPNEPRVKHR